ncbi:hypothetical protein T02_5262 [Trichinella nativa]|uniref:Uncharacterized protein n=1 Tax=Trichinella nativa TaxID=6335 RepID=A0A0V1L444_9BILA|nr:hypothetical protein T02_5262 [Trichinella nativa]
MKNDENSNSVAPSAVKSKKEKLKNDENYAKRHVAQSTANCHRRPSISKDPKSPNMHIIQ